MGTEQDEAIKHLFMLSANMLAGGKSKADIFKTLQEKGCPADLASSIVDRVISLKSEATKKSGKDTLIMGAGMLLLGTLVTAGTYSAASGGGHYVVTSGLFVVGGWFVIKGLWKTVTG